MSVESDHDLFGWDATAVDHDQWVAWTDGSRTVYCPAGYDPNSESE
jgi:hypothetical protein